MCFAVGFGAAGAAAACGVVADAAANSLAARELGIVGARLVQPGAAS